MKYLALLFLAPAALAYDLTWNVDGYYRTRATYIRNLANQPEHDAFQGTAERLRETQFLLQRARIEPRLQLEKIVKFQLTIDALDDMVWGDNNALSAAPVFAVNPTSTNLHGETIPTANIRRAWVEFNVPIGQLRVGRMPSHWGMGLLSNGGGTSGCDWATPDSDAAKFQCLDGYFDDDFGDNHFGSVNDRILFATRPLQIYKTITKHKDPTSNFVVAYAYDKLVEDYFNIPLEQQLLAETYSDLKRGATPSDPLSQRPYGESAFLSRDDDVQEHVLVLLYNNPDFDWFRLSDELRGGVYMVFRSQPKSHFACVHDSDGEKTFDDTPACNPDYGPGDITFVGEGSNIQIYDFWYRLRLGWLYSETEFYTIRGHTDGGVPIGTQVSELREKDAEIYGLATRVGYESQKLDGVFEIGHASGDSDVTDTNFTQRPTHPDYNVGLLLYEEVVRELTARTIGRLVGLGGYVFNSRSLQSNGGVINSTYIFPRVRYRPVDFVEVIGGFVAAWWDEKGLLPTAQVPNEAGGGQHDSSSFIGWEVNGATKLTWADNHLSWTLETAYMRFGQGLYDAYRFGGAPTLFSEVKGAATIQSRLALVF